MGMPAAWLNQLYITRPDVEVVRVGGPRSTRYVDWRALPLPDGSLDAVAMYGMVAQTVNEKRIFSEARRVLRPGGRLLAFVDHATTLASLGAAPQPYAEMLIRFGFVRVLSEVLAHGVFCRGEKAYKSEFTTVERIAATARPALTGPALTTLLQGESLMLVRARYLHVLIQETPNIPVWRRTPDDVIGWQTPLFQATAGRLAQQQFVLAFSALPKAVAFMQTAVLSGLVHDINKIAKYRKSVAVEWPFPVLLNATSDVASNFSTNSMVKLDPNKAESPDE